MLKLRTIWELYTENNPEYAQAFVNLAVTLASQSRFAEAESALQNALRIEPDDEQAQAVHARLQAQLSQQTKVDK